ncbi:MAG: DUF3795 domain-containing protein [Candidatus Shapirobacteria bacterium]|jgi:hypothetical protein
MRQGLIAPCGMNCGTCSAYLREKNKCPGCRQAVKTKYVSIRKCVIRKCEQFKAGTNKFCGKWCTKFPCLRLQKLDKRYREKYEMSMLENLENIRNLGIEKFGASETKRWTRGDKVYCVHKHIWLTKKIDKIN